MSKLFFVTGATGFLASHIVQQLAEQGHRVRATARAKKVAALRDLYQTLPLVEVVEVDDIATCHFEDALKGVDAVIHTATPLPGRTSLDELESIAVEGNLNILRQGEKVGVKTFVVTSTLGTLFGDPRQGTGSLLLDDYWVNPTKEEVAPEGGKATAGYYGYVFAKTAAERALWAWAEENPHVYVTTINPPWLYGPYVQYTLPPAPGDFKALSTNLILYNLIYPKGMLPPSPGYADVREVAKAHIGAAMRPNPSAIKGRRRALITAPFGFDNGALLELLKKERPNETKGRLNEQPIGVSPYAYDRYYVDYVRLEELTGLKGNDFHTVEQTLLDSIDSLLKVEAQWKEAGYIVDHIPPQDL